MTGNKAVMAVGAAIALFYLVTSPTDAAEAVRAAGDGMQHVGHQFAVFLNALV